MQAEGGFRKQLEAALGRPVEVVWEAEMQERVRVSDRAEFRRQMERFTTVIDIGDLLAGHVKATGDCMLLASLQRGGILVQLRELVGSGTTKT